MNPHKYFASADLISNPLCGISTYKDIINLATGQITRAIKKLVLTGEESWDLQSINSNGIANFLLRILTRNTNIVISHFKKQITNIGNTTDEGYLISLPTGASDAALYLRINSTTASTVAELKTWLSEQHSNGTTVTIWYVLETSETEQITVPSGLSGTVEGYLIQDGTPTPEAPIYPTANTAKGWYNINAYKRSVLVWNTDTAYERSDGSWT